MDIGDIKVERELVEEGRGKEKRKMGVDVMSKVWWLCMKYNVVC